MTIEEGVGELSEFTQGKPTAIYDLDLLAAIPDCEQLGLSIWDWTTKAGPTDVGLKASAYAKHGDNLYKFIGCGTAANRTRRRHDATGPPLRHVRGGQRRRIRRLPQGHRP